mmetsp:Transcript_9/g.25  ORF Transcript_9/g.25 Transcript_9/m.25 type:complete len:291 (-) Transcript_9:277-1149(-)
MLLIAMIAMITMIDLLLLVIGGRAADNYALARASLSSSSSVIFEERSASLRLSAKYAWFSFGPRRSSFKSLSPSRAFKASSRDAGRGIDVVDSDDSAGRSSRFWFRPSKPLYRSAANPRYKLHEASTNLHSTWSHSLVARLEHTRIPTSLSSRAHPTCEPVQQPGPTLRNELVVGRVRPRIAGRCARIPSTKKAPLAEREFPLQKSGSPVVASLKDMCTCIPFPAFIMSYLGRKRALRPCFRATAEMVSLAKTTLSTRPTTSSECFRTTSICPGPDSAWINSMGMDCCCN